MRTKRSEVISLADLKPNLFVRQELDSEHVLFLAQLIEEKVVLPPIEITEDMILVDGRHRKGAYEMNDITKVEAKILVFDDEQELIGYAYKANCGGSKPPTPADTEHTIRLLLEKKLSAKRISELIGLPGRLTRKYVENVQSQMNRQKLQQARAAVAEDGLKVTEAAEKYGADVEKLKELLSGQKSKKRKDEIADICRELSKSYKSNGLKSANALRHLMEAYKEGDVTDKHVLQVFEHIKNHQERSRRSLKEWLDRFEALIAAGKEERSKVA